MAVLQSNNTKTTANSQPAFVWCDNLVKIYKIADLEVVALPGLDLEVPPGEIMALVGPSGAGKSTLLNVIGGLDTSSAGAVRVSGWDLLKMSQRDRVQFKREVVGFVWQQPSSNLLPYLTARENVELPMILAGKRAGQRRRRALELLDVALLQDIVALLQDIVALLQDIVAQTGITVILATHDAKVMEAADVVLALQDGQLIA